MKYDEVCGDLFSRVEDKEVYFAHCISADFELGLGIAVEFVHRFDTKYKLMKQYPDYLSRYKEENLGGDCLLVENVFNLITKEHYWNKPTIDTMRLALLRLKDLCIEHNVKELAMPRIGAGLDRLPWYNTSELIQEIFKDTDIHITVYVK